MRPVPGHARCGFRGLGRGGRPAGSGRARASQSSLRRDRPTRGLRVDVGRDAHAHPGRARSLGGSGLPDRGAPRSRRRGPARRHRPPGSQGRAVEAHHPAQARRSDDRRRALRRDPPLGHLRPPALRVVRDQRRGLRPGRGARPGRDRDQDDGLPDERRVTARARADRGGRERQAERLPRRAESALRRAPQHRVVTGPRALRRARRLRLSQPEDPREDDARRPARGATAFSGTSTSARATTTRSRRAATRISGSSRPTRRSAETSPISSIT